MMQINLKKSMGNGCNGLAVALLFVALLFLITNPNMAIVVGVVAAASAIVGTLLKFQIMFEKWKVPHVSFHMKQVGIRGRRGCGDISEGVEQ